MHARLIASLFAVTLFAACGSQTSPSGGGGSASTTTTTTAAGGHTGSTSTGSGGSTTGGTGGGATSSSGSTSSSSGAGGGCATSPTFAEVLAKPLSGCAGLEPPCHNSGAGGLKINPQNATATWKQLVGVTATIPGAGVRVVPGDPAHSFLYRKLTNLDLTPAEAPPMPEHSGVMLGDAGTGWQELPATEIEMVRCWIQEGAPNN